MSKVCSSKLINLVFICKSVLENQLAAWLKSTRAKEQTDLEIALITNLCLQTYPFIAVGGINDLFLGVQHAETAANILDALLDGLVGVSNRDMKWPELRAYWWEHNGYLPELEAVLDCLPGSVVDSVYDFTVTAVQALDKLLVFPVTGNRRYHVEGICITDRELLCVKITLGDPFYSF